MSASAKDILLEEYHKLVPTCTLEERGHRIRFYTPSPHVKALVDTIFVAEPETIDWISHFDPEDIFYYRKDKGVCSITIDGRDTRNFRDTLGSGVCFGAFLEDVIDY